MSNAQAVTTSDWDAEVLQSDKPVLVDFWAEWCAPCRAISPIVDEVAGELADSLKVVKLDVDESPDTARSYKVMSIPALLVFQDGVEKKRINARSKQQMLSELEEFV